MIRTFVPLFALALVASVPALAAELVPVPQFNSVELLGGGNVVLVPGPVERVAILEGSSRITHIAVDHQARLKIQACERDCPNHYRLRIEIQSPRVPALAVDGGGEINVAGGFAAERRLVAAVNGGGKIDTRAVDAADVTAAVNGGGDLFVHAGLSLTGAVHGGGVVRYWGNPRVTSAIEGGGSIQPGH